MRYEYRRWKPLHPINESAFGPEDEEFARLIANKLGRRFRFSTEEIEDVAQEAVIRVRDDFVSRPSTGPQAIRGHRARITTIVSNEVRRFYAKKSGKLRPLSFEELDFNEDEPVAKEVKSNELTDAVSSVMAEKEFELFSKIAELRATGLTNAEVAKILKCAKWDVRKEFAAGRSKLRARLNDLGFKI